MSSTPSEPRNDELKKLTERYGLCPAGKMKDSSGERAGVNLDTSVRHINDPVQDNWSPDKINP